MSVSKEGGGIAEKYSPKVLYATLRNHGKIALTQMSEMSTNKPD